MKEEKIQESARPRRRYYVDHLVQGRLLAILLALELMLLMMAIYAAYLDISSGQTVVAGQQGELLVDTLVANVLLRIVPWVILVNLVMVLSVSGVWRQYVRSIITPLQELLASVERLDLRGNGRIDSKHEALAIGRRWIMAERERHIRIRDGIRQLNFPTETFDSAASRQLRGQLEQIKSLLP